MLDKEFQDLREKRQNIFAIFMTLLTAFGVIAYGVLSGDKPIYMFLAATAILFLGFINANCNAYYDYYSDWSSCVCRY